MIKLTLFCASGFFVALFSSLLMGQEHESIDPSSVSSEVIVELTDTPWGLAQLDETTIIYTLRKGSVGIVDLTNKKKLEVTGTPLVASIGQGGLLDVAVPDDYATSRWIYFTYSKMSDDLAVTTLARAKLEGAKLVEWTDLLVSNSATSKGVHFGSRITFDEQGYVYFGIGDRGVRANSQN